MFNVSIVGGSGYGGGELLRLLLNHPGVNVQQVTSERFAGKRISKVHPNLRRRTDLAFCSLEELTACDLLLLSLPHGHASSQWQHFQGLAPKVIDLSADFRLESATDYLRYYGRHHPQPHLLQSFVYGIPEVNRDAIRKANFVAGAGCNATASILALFPLLSETWLPIERAVIDAKVGSSEAGNRSNDASHHPVRSGAVRSFKPTDHRHLGEIRQILGQEERHPISFSATAIDMVRGILVTCHLFPKARLSEKDVWKRFRTVYGQEPFIRIVKEREGSYRYPEPKILSGTNYCDLGFELSQDGKHLVVIAAIDNLMKGAAGQALQCMNLMLGFEETTGLEFSGLHPI